MKRNFSILTVADKLQHTTSLPNLESKLMKLYSVASIVSEKNGSQANMVTSSCQEQLTADDLNREVPSPTFPKQQITLEKTSDNISSSKTNLPMIESSRSNDTIDSGKTNRSNNSFEAYLDEQSSNLKSESPDSKIITAKSTITEQYDWDREINQQSKAILPPMANSSQTEESSHFQEEKIFSNTNLDKSVKIPSKQSDQIQLLPTIDERSQSSVSFPCVARLSCLPSASILPI